MGWFGCVPVVSVQGDDELFFLFPWLIHSWELVEICSGASWYNLYLVSFSYRDRGHCFCSVRDLTRQVSLCFEFLCGHLAERPAVVPRPDDNPHVSRRFCCPPPAVADAAACPNSANDGAGEAGRAVAP